MSGIDCKRFLKEGVLAVALLLLSFGFYYFYLCPSSRSLDDVKSSIGLLKRQISTFENIDKAEENIASFFSILNHKEAFPGIIDYISDLGNTHKVQIPSIQYDMRTVKRLDMTHVDIRFSVLGNYRDIRYFLYDLENSHFFLVIDDISISSHSQKVRGVKDAQQASMNIKVAAYFS